MTKVIFIISTLLLSSICLGQTKLDKEKFKCSEFSSNIFDHFRNRKDSVFFQVGKIILMEYEQIEHKANTFCTSENNHLKVIKYKGEILFEYNLVDGAINGIGFCYYPFLKKTAMIGEFKNGKLHGELHVFDKEGLLLEVMVFKKGKYKKHKYIWNEPVESTLKNPVRSKSNPLLNEDVIVR